MVHIMVGVAFDHLQAFVATDSFNGWEIHTSLDEVGNGGMAQGVAQDTSGVETHSINHPPEGAFNAFKVAGFGCV